MIQAVKGKKGRRRFGSREQYAEAFGSINRQWVSDRTTLLDVAIANGTDRTVGLIDETAVAHPEITRGAARSIKETSYKTLLLTKRPVVGFRKTNQGAVRSKAEYENRRVECYPFNPRWDADVMAAREYEDGPEAYIAIQARVAADAAMAHVCRQFFDGNDMAFGGNDAAGFPGLRQCYDRNKLEVDAGGDTDFTSVYAVRWGMTDVQWVWGAGGSMEPTDVSIRDVHDKDGKAYSAYVQEIQAHVGVQVVSQWSVGRIKKIGSGTGKLTDALLGKLFASFPASYKPHEFYLTTRSLEQLRASRTATNPTGAEAPYPTDWNGVPLIVTDSITNAELATW